MTLSEYLKLPEGGPVIIKIGERFRWPQKSDREISQGTGVFYFEVINVTSNSYEATQVYTILE